MKKTNVALIILILSALLLNILPIIIFNNDGAITKYSIPSVAVIIFSVIYAIIAYSLRNRGNLILGGRNKLFLILMRTFSADKSYTMHPEYKKEFIRTSMIYCIAIPFYIPLAFFADNIYSAIFWPLSWYIIVHVVIMLIAFIPPIKNIIETKKAKKVQDEIHRQEQERLESMGKWK